MLCFIFLFYIAVVLQLSDGRKYDIEEECRKLYGENLNKVLKRFRRTPDYLKILESRMEEIVKYNAEVTQHLILYQETELKNKIYEMFNLTSASENRDSLRAMRDIFRYPTNIGSIGNYRKYVQHKKKGKREGEETESPARPEELNRKDGDDKSDNGDATTQSPIEILDEAYSTNFLTVTERNMFRDIGFEFAGKLIHSVIASMDDDCSMKSTRFPVEGKHTVKHSAVTEHVHEVSTTPNNEETTPAGAEGEGDETYYRNNVRIPHRKPRMY